MAVGGAPCSPGRLSAAVAILHDVGRALRTIGKAGADERLGLHELAELAELINPDVVGVDSPPYLVGKRHARIAVANPIFPFVFARIANAAAPANQRRL